MIFVYILTPLLVIVIILYILIKKAEKKLISQTKEMLGHYGNFNDDNQSLIINNDTFKVVFYKVPSHAKFTINSPKIWEIRTHSNQKIMNVSNLLSGSEKKLIIIYPNNSRIKRYINENEMVFIDDTFFLNMYMITIDKLEPFLATLKGDDTIGV
ncbi:hypothetical protein KHQ89_04255 [Mycoplasmatota bacterium]|nr:hypothetical protein KHQ89_04255 [Mycoplasmatota bacterium]